jgi:GntP family gluconate:H+ symporter
LSSKNESELPPFGFSVLPIIIPVVLIAGKTILNIFSQAEQETSVSIHIITQLGDSNIALAIAAVCALILLAWHKRTSRKELSVAVYKALASAGIIILITASGGAFGNILQQTAVGPRIQELAAGYQIAILPLAFFVTAMVRTAQGSATVAMITAVGMLSVFADPATLGCHPVYLALIIGCGSKLFPWMNDSGFWLISRMAGLTESETIKTFSMTLSSMAFAGLLVILLLSWIFPLI